MVAAMSCLCRRMLRAIFVPGEVYDESCKLGLTTYEYFGKQPRVVRCDFHIGLMPDERTLSSLMDTYKWKLFGKNLRVLLDNWSKFHYHIISDRYQVGVGL